MPSKKKKREVFSGSTWLVSEHPITLFLTYLEPPVLYCQICKLVILNSSDSQRTHGVRFLYNGVLCDSQLSAKLLWKQMIMLDLFQLLTFLSAGFFQLSPSGK